MSSPQGVKVLKKLQVAKRISEKTLKKSYITFEDIKVCIPC